MIIIANIFGLVSGLVFWCSNLKTTKRDRTKLHLICNISDLMQYICTYSISGIVDVIIAFTKNMLFLYVKSEKLRNLMIYIVSFCKILILVVVHENIIVLFKIILEILKVIILCKGKIKHLLWIGILDSIVWMMYDFNAKAYVAALMGIGSIISIIVGMIKNRGKLESKK